MSEHFCILLLREAKRSQLQSTYVLPNVSVRFYGKLTYYLALINRARGLYGRILTEVVSTDRKEVRSVHTTEVKILPYRPT